MRVFLRLASFQTISRLASHLRTGIESRTPTNEPLQSVGKGTENERTPMAFSCHYTVIWADLLVSCHVLGG